MALENKLNITNQVELAKAEERISKKYARQVLRLRICSNGRDKIILL